MMPGMPDVYMGQVHT